MAWTKEQEDAITRTGENIIVSAGAGSGKTAVLTERTIRKLINGGNINRLLILTFTNAAAAEMKDRIRLAIKRSNLKEQLDYLDSAYITTFDSFSLSIVKKYHYLLGIPEDVSIMDNSIEVIKTNEIMNTIFENMYGDSEFEKFIGDFCTKDDEMLKSIVKDISKKLDLLENKKEYLENYSNNFFEDTNLDKYIKSYLGLINNKVKEMYEPYKSLMSLTDKKFMDTYNLEPLLNSNTYNDIKENITKIGSPRKNNNCEEDFVIYKDILNNIIKELKELTRFEDEDEMKESLLSTKPYINSICKIINKFDIEFNKYKNLNNLYTFSDIALLAIKLISTNDSVREELKNSFDEIMVDEYQDTSDIQERFINLISNNNVYMVGDIKQSIYRFRHANPYIFRDKYNNYSNCLGGVKIDLLKNFRSRREVLDNINLIFNLIMDEKVGDADYIKSHQMNFGNINYEQSLKTNEDNNMDILTYTKEELEEYSTDEIEAFTIAYDIKNKIDNNYQVVDKETSKLRNCTYKDFAIIMDRGTSFDLYKKIFEYVGIPITQIKNEKLTSGDDLLIIKNLINLIIKINNKEYDDLFKYYFTSVSRSFIQKLSDEEIFDIIKNNKYYDTELFKICKSININEISSNKLLELIIDKFNYYEKIITTNNIQERILKIEYLKDLSVNLSNIGYTPIDFSLYLNDMLREEVIEYSLNSNFSNSVKILNIHKSKGLEYNICYFTGLSKKNNNSDIKARFLVDDKFNLITPYVNSGVKNTILKDLLIDSYTRDNISEKIRLFYVALTRAKEKMVLILPNNDKVESFNTLVPIEIRLKYNSISDMLDSIKLVLEPYIKPIDFNKVKLTHDYDKIKKYNYKKEITGSNIKINKKVNNINYELIEESRFSKHTKKLITQEEYTNMKEGVYLHYIFETEDFKTTKNPYVLKFLEQIDKDYINVYKEYEFIYEDDKEIKHGFIDLMLEYNSYINIVDYKMKNITDDAYLKQLNGYKKYIETISKKQVNIYLYSILDNKLQILNDML